MGEQVVEVAGALADQVREDLALLLARQIRAGGGGGQVELRRIARVVPSCHESYLHPGTGINRLNRRPPNGANAQRARPLPRC